MFDNDGKRRERPCSAVEGGYRLIGVTQLFAAWWAYEQGHLQFRDLRTYFALHEMTSRRCTMRKGRSPCFTLEELGRLVGGSDRKPLAASVRRLENAGLSTWNTSELLFNEINDLPATADEGIHRTPRQNHQSPAPGSCPTADHALAGDGYPSRSRGHGSGAPLPVCLCQGGSCRRGGVRLGILGGGGIRCGPPERQTRQGAIAGLELAVAQAERPLASAALWGHGDRESDLGGRGQSSRSGSKRNRNCHPGRLKRHADLPPPDSNKKLPKGIKNQKPATPGRSGVQKTHSSNPHPAEHPTDDLRDADRVLVLFRQAQERRLGGQERTRALGVCWGCRPRGRQSHPKSRWLLLESGSRPTVASRLGRRRKPSSSDAQTASVWKSAEGPTVPVVQRHDPQTSRRRSACRSRHSITASTRIPWRSLRSRDPKSSPMDARTLESRHAALADSHEVRKDDFPRFMRHAAVPQLQWPAKELRNAQR